MAKLSFPALEAQSGRSRDADAEEDNAGEDLAGMELSLRLAAVREEALQQARSELLTRLLEERRRMDRLRLEFARDRKRFFASAEGQVVKLALAIASSVLAREVEADGLPLLSIVHAALARVQVTSTTRLRVPLDELAEWESLFKRESAGKVEVVGDPAMLRGDCALETDVGTVEFGIETQLKEIARGFAELSQE